MDYSSMYGLPAPGGLLGSFGGGGNYGWGQNGNYGSQAMGLLGMGSPYTLGIGGNAAPNYGYGGGGTSRAQIPADMLAYVQKALTAPQTQLTSPYSGSSSGGGSDLYGSGSSGSSGGAGSTSGLYGTSGTGTSSSWLSLLNSLGLGSGSGSGY